MHHLFHAIRQVLCEYSEFKAVSPIHMNLAVRHTKELGDCKQIHIIESVEEFDYHNFKAFSYLYLTSFGGIQKECPSRGVPVRVMRDTSKRSEDVDTCTLKQVGTNEEVTYNAFAEHLDNKEVYEKMSKACNPCGDGHVCGRIVDMIF